MSKLPNSYSATLSDINSKRYSLHFIVFVLIAINYRVEPECTVKTYVKHVAPGS